MDINIESVKELLDSRNIKKIIYVDNDFGIGSYENNSKEFVRCNASNEDFEWPFDYSADVDILLYNFNSWWVNASEDTREEFVLKNSIDREKTYIEQVFNEIFPIGIIEYVKPKDFSGDYLTKHSIKIDAQNQVLILMDKHLSDTSDGMKELDAYRDQEYISCGLFSDRFEIEGEIICWYEYDCPKNIYPISKRRLDNDGSYFLGGLRNTIWLSQISETKDKIPNILNGALADTFQDIKRLDPASFDFAVITKSHEEGCWEFDILERIIMTMFEKHLHRHMIKEENFKGFQEQIANIKAIRKFKDSVKPQPELLKGIVKHQVYYPGDYINGILSQISNGDIFIIKNKYYMLVCQPCNLALRGDGNRNANDYVHLLPILEFNPERDYSNKHIYKLYLLHDEKAYYVDLARNIKISPCILDLVSYNTTGSATIDISKESKDLESSSCLQEHMLKHYDKILKEINKHLKLEKAIQDSDIPRTEKEQLIKLVKKPHRICTDVGFIKAEQTGDSIDFGIQRLGRYREIYAQIVLNSFMNYLSRQALPTDIQYKVSN